MFDQMTQPHKKTKTYVAYGGNHSFFHAWKKSNIHLETSFHISPVQHFPLKYALSHRSVSRCRRKMGCECRNVVKV